MPGRAVRAPLVVAAAALAALLAASVVSPSGPPPARGAPAGQRPAGPQAQGSDPAAACQDHRGGRPVACPHGNDVPPPGVSLFHRPSLEQLRERTTLRSPSPRLRGLAALGQATTGPAGPAGQAAVPCIGDGTSGNRVQMVSPPGGSYLAGHWNTAGSSFLEAAVGALPARLTLTGAATITYGGHASLGGRLSDRDSGAALAGQAVNLWGRRAGTSSWRSAGTDSTAADGSFQPSPAPSATTAYRASFAGNDRYGTAGSGQVTVAVRTRVTARKSTGTVRLGGSFTVTGTVSPNHAGQRVYLQRLVSGAWKTAATADLSSGSGYTLRAKPPTRVASPTGSTRAPTATTSPPPAPTRPSPSPEAAHADGGPSSAAWRSSRASTSWSTSPRRLKRMQLLPIDALGSWSL